MPPHQPPEPAIPPRLLATAAQLRHVVFARTPDGVQLGELREPGGARWLLTIISAFGSLCIVEWALVKQAEGLDAIPVLLTKKAGEVLTRGTLDGADVQIKGERYRLRLLWATDPQRRLYADAVEA